MNSKLYKYKLLKDKYNIFKGYWAYNHKKTICNNFPHIHIIEITNRCNLRCVFCPTHTVLKRKKHDMPYDVFHDITKKYHNNIADLSISHHGESLLHRNITDIVSLLAEHSIRTLLTTNATLLTEDISRHLLENYTKSIMISIESINPDTYNRLRVNANLDKVLKNIKTLLEIKREMGADCEIIIRTIDLKETKEELGTFIDFWTRLEGINYVEVGEFNEWGGRIKRANFAKLTAHQERRPHVCPQPWKHCIINSSAEVFICNNHEDVALEDSNILNRDIKDIWNSKEYQSIRYNLLNDKTKSEICRHCDYIEGCKEEYPNPAYPLTVQDIKKAVTMIKRVVQI